ncbi:phage portal protein [Limosilactobacillus vaginalis]|uniref:Phage portal protein n=1 Tax=Limosilactobacillus vaginalis TaxID=1633 RepID=A0ABT4K887_9LACO|nr:phage portal protein [Limosilactobacillus vaginalis]MCZ3747071.1 phage portal protein [Limosilactobacillus vaginalis]MCZ3752053.1 phage portal protein [Limosilactobacillus vaginalis]MCZ3753741.1 phage portal protein [Limosilactobacillus vaginalis]MCZ3755479.1 phage portal protein [Limosilactobacillus vaginalis]MCZ3757176.1 phage portal protein [Limosilactobacillus vaginalis]
MQNTIPQEHRFDLEANRQYQVPISFFNSIKDNPMQLYETAYKFIRHHIDRQVPRLKELMKYYLADTKIKSWAGSPNPDNAHNRVSTGFARYITNIRVGYFMGNDVQYKIVTDDDSEKQLSKTLDDLITHYNDSSNTPYIDEMLKKDLSITGRAYDLVYVNAGETTLNLAKVDPTTCFVVYDDSIKAQPLFAVRYYQTGVLDELLQENYEIYTDSMIYRYHSDGGLPQTNSPVNNAVLDSAEPHFFERVPLTEYKNNDERIGDWEPEIDQMDALDKAISTMANFQEDFNDAAMVATGRFANKTKPVYEMDDRGNIKVGKDGKPIVLVPPKPIIDPKHHIFYLEPYIARTGLSKGQRTVVTPTLQYVTKQYDSAGWSTYTNFLINEIHKYTNTPNVNDPNFASNASGVAMSYKLWGSDQERKIQEALYKRSLRARISACIAYWNKINALPGENDISVLADMVKPNFDPNLPKNDEETAQLVQTLSGIPGLESMKSLREITQRITGVSPDDEQQRIDDEAYEEAKKSDDYKNGRTGIGEVFATGEPAQVKQPKGDK